MKLKSFRVKNFKSVADSEECDLASDVTVLAGKNESGKTSVLEALSKFSVTPGGDDLLFKQEELPLRSNEKPEISLTFDISSIDVQKVVDAYGMNLAEEEKQAFSSRPITVIRSYDGKYAINSTGSIFGKAEAELGRHASEAARVIKSSVTKLTSLIQTLGVSVPSSQNQVLSSADEEHRTAYINHTEQVLIPELEGLLPTLDSTISEQLVPVLEEVKASLSPAKDAFGLVASFSDNITPFFPNIVYFNSFDDLLPYSIEITKMAKNKSAKNFLDLTQVDTSVLSSANTQARRNELSVKTRGFEVSFEDSWHQDKVKIVPRIDGGEIVFGVFDSDDSTTEFKPEQRSQGLKWFISFYLTLQAESKDGSIILVDEPGLFVHAKAQNDILEILSNLTRTQNAQVVIATHSPYLIDPNRLDRVRLVIRDAKVREDGRNKTLAGTKIFTVHSDINIDPESLTPVITAIGLDISKQLTLACERNVLVEGISDYFYLHGLKKILPAATSQLLDQINIVPLTGASNSTSIASILMGWGLKFAVLVDNDSKGNEIKTKLTQDLLISEDKIIKVPDSEGEIEDLFSKEDFNRHVLEADVSYRAAEKNSQVIPDQQKATRSREFFSKTTTRGAVVLSSETKRNFRGLFQKILEAVDSPS